MIMADHHVVVNGMEVPSRKESNCVRCRNHGLKIILRGHKQYCPYASCTCEKCRFTAEQQRQMRLQNAIRRAEAAERGGMRRPRSSAPTMVPTPQTKQQQQPPVPQQIVVTVQNAQQNGITVDKKLLFDCSSELLKKFRYPWEMMPIMYALSKYANGNIDEILQRIDEGQYAVNEQLRLQTLNMYFGAAQQQQQQQQQNNAAVATTTATRECG